MQNNSTVENHQMDQQKNREMLQQNPVQQKNSTLPQEDQILLANFMQQPFSFVPPPIFHDQGLRGYREGFEAFIEPFTDHYEMFNQKYSLKTSKPITQVEKTPAPHKISNLKQKIFNLKFIGYTILATMIETLKNIRRQDTTNEKLKSCHSLMKKKIQQFFQEANQLKETFRRLEAIHLLEKETAYLEKQSKNISQILSKIEKYVLLNQNQPQHLA